MPTLITFSDIATIQPSLKTHLLPVGSHSINLTKNLPNPWIQSRFSKNLKFYSGHFHVRRGNVLITAVTTTLETKHQTQKKDEQSFSLPSADQNGSSDEVDNREKLRRVRISKANTGNTPWNKGKKHSPETLQKIRERTRLAMQDPKVKMKLVNFGHAQNKETRLKIGEGVRMRWAWRNERRKVQESCHFEWQNLLAEAAKEGYKDEEELQWNSYQILDQKNQLEWLECVEQRKVVKGTKSNRRAPKSLEQRRKIAEAIAAKWADPSYREKVCSGLAKYHGIPTDPEKRRRRRSNINTEPKIKNPPKKTSEIPRRIQVAKVRKRKAPVFKDPLANSKLEMIKDIRAKRVAEESKKMNAVEQAKLLISEAEKAVKVLEIAAMKSPVAQASLLESKKLIAEATELIESIITSDEDGTFSDLDDDSKTEQGREINGTCNLRQNTTQELGKILKPNGVRVHPPLETNGSFEVTENRRHLLPNGYNGKEEKIESLESGNVTKKWVRGRLVEVTEAV